MSDQAKPLAKSLHTVSVLVHLARFIRCQSWAAPWSDVQCIDHACAILELDGKPDVYDLKGQALKQLSK